MDSGTNYGDPSTVPWVDPEYLRLIQLGLNPLFARERTRGDTPPPPPGPDMTDLAVHQARLAARRRIMLGAGMDSTFLSGPLGISTMPNTLAPTAGGA